MNDANLIQTVHEPKTLKRDVTKTFRKLDVGDRIWFGCHESLSHTIKAIDTVERTGGRRYYIEFRNQLSGETVSRCLEVNPSKLDKDTAHLKGDSSAVFFTCREAAIRYEIASYKKKIRSLEWEIRERQYHVDRFRQYIETLKESLS